MPLADWLFSLVLLFNLTGLFGFVAPFLGVKVAVVSAVLMLFNLAYLGYRAPLALRVARSPTVGLWAVVILAWPLLTVLYSPVLSVRHLAVLFYNLSIVLAAATYVVMNGWARLRQLAAIAVAVTIIGLLLSWLVPGMFAAAAALTESRQDYQGRAFGFFLQPNIAAENTVFMAVLWLAGDRVARVGRTALRVVVFGAAALVTGSRAGSAVAAGVRLMAIAEAGARAGTRRRYSTGLRVVRAATLLLLGAGGLALVLTLLSRSGQGLAAAGLERVASVLEIGKGGSVSADGSASERLVAMAQYVGYIARRPLTGYGLGTSDAYRANGLLIRSSHNVFLEAGLNYGLLYVAFLLLVMFLTFRDRQRGPLEEGLKSAAVLQFLAALLMAGMVSNTILDSRVLLVALGGLLGGLRFPERVTAPRTARVPAGNVVAAPVAPEPA